jgi:hypothetical protein
MTTLTIIAGLVIFALGVFAGLSVPKIKSWFAAEEARAASDVKSAATTAATDVQKATQQAASTVAADVKKI